MRLDFLQATGTEERLARSAFLRAIQEQGFRQARDRDEKRKEREADAADDTVDLIQSVVLASASEIQAFEVRLDTYDVALIEALQRNEEDLRLARERVEKHLDEAFALEDGRRVFKTEDGTRVFDEHGNELARDEIDPDVIGDHRPRWEQFKADKETHAHLVSERTHLLSYQQKLDDARERLAQGDLSKREIEQLDALMADEMPEAVKRQLPDYEASASMMEPRAASASGPILTEPNFDLEVDGPLGPS